MKLLTVIHLVVRHRRHNDTPSTDGILRVTDNEIETSFRPVCLFDHEPA